MLYAYHQLQTCESKPLEMHSTITYHYKAITDLRWIINSLMFFVTPQGRGDREGRSPHFLYDLIQLAGTLKKIRLAVGLVNFCLGL